jgi:endoglucanase
LGIFALSYGCATADPASAPTRAELDTQPDASASSPLSQPQKPERAKGNPLSGVKLFVDPGSNAAATAEKLRASDPEKAKVLERIAQVPQAIWLGEWSGDVKRYVSGVMDSAVAQNSRAVFIAYNVPYRDCGNHSRGGLSSKELYQRWVRDIRAGLAGRHAAIVLEPDALGHLQECLSDAQREERFALIKDAVWVFRQDRTTAVYIDAGHARWVPADQMAERLKLAGVEDAQGFALNTSNYVTTEENLGYGKKLSELVGGAHFVIDTSRNGNGPAPGDEWCNPKGRKIGQLPTTDTADPLCDAYLWLKRPGESDGECNGGPSAGTFWLEQALEQGGK